jgi:hypothetical protein
LRGKPKKRPSLLSAFAIGVCLCLCLQPAIAEVIDRIVAVVDAHIITLSDLRQEREVRAQLGEKSADDDATITNQLTDAYLIDQQIADYPNIEVTTADVDSALQKVKPPLTKPSEPVLNSVRQRIRIQKFFDVKFRELIRPTDAEIQKYYDEKFVPEARTRGLDKIPPLTDQQVVDGIRENVIQEKLDHEVDVWLEAVRKRSKVEVLK